MTAFWMTCYVLIWPLIVAGTLFYIARAFFAEWRESRRRGERII
ncbi:putative transporter small subunit [Mycetocola spongiae]|nr:putative transporter small subunit [Mycetocola spongiae]UCR90230.1 putative transporter small subunit [Mycetocola spongiae]